MSTGTLESRAARLAALVGRARLSFVATVLAAGLLLACAVALVWVVGGLLLDLATPLSVAGRVAVWCGWWAVVATAGVAFVCLPAWRRPVLASMALRIERALGGMHNRLLTVIDLTRHGRTAAGFQTSDGRHLRPELVAQLLDQTQERMRSFRAALVLPWRTVLRNLLIVAAAAATIAALHLGLGERFVVTLRRLLDPTADIPPATWLQLKSPGDLDVLRGEPFEIEARVVRSTVDAVDLVLYDAAGRASRQPMHGLEAGVFTAALEGLDRPCRFRLEGGNTWTKTHDIRILERPEILTVTRRVRLPDYMRISAALPVEPEAIQIKAPVGATAEFEAVATAEAVEGDLKLFERAVERRLVERFDERVWFDDDLPRDAVSEAPWKWTTAEAAGGLRSFTFAGDGRPVSMRTRLEPLVLPRDRLESRAVMVMARIDAGDPPTRLSFQLEHPSGRTELVWGDATQAPPAPGAARVAAGPLPAAGVWTRLTAPMTSLANLAGQAVTGATFSVDRGRILLDRPGWVERSEEEVMQSIDTPTGRIALARTPVPAAASNVTPGPTAGSAWGGSVPVADPTWVAIELRSRQGHPSLPAPPVELVPTIDAPPSIVVDATPETLTLKVAADVPIRGHGFDDWGIDAVSVLIGPDPDHLGEPIPLPDVALDHSPPPSQVPFATALPPEALGIGPGKSAAWKLRIRDTKGQIAETPVYRVVVMMPPESELAKTQVPSLAQARRKAEQLAQEAEKRAAVLDARQDAVREALASDRQPEKKSVEEVAQRLDQERRLAEQVAKAVEKAAEEASRSPLVPQEQQERIAALAGEARALERRLAGERRPDQPATAEAADAVQAQAPPERTPAEKAAAAKAERVAEAPRQQQVAATAEELAQSLEAVAQRLDAHGAALQLDALVKDLSQRAERLAERPQGTEPTPAEKLSLRQQVRDVEQILGQRFPEPKPAPSGAPQPAAPTDTAAVTPKPPTATPGPGEKAASEPPAASPSVAEATTPGEAARRAATASARAAADLASRLTGKPAGAAQPDAEPSASAPPTNPTASAAAEVESVLESEEVRQALAMAERARRLQERDAASAAAAAKADAARARRDQAAGTSASPGGAPPGTGSPTDAGAEQPAGPQGPTAGGSQAGRTEIDAADPLRGLDAKQRAALYKLPPRIRDPLLDGMRQRGPAAYQDVIDTYFRQLGKDIPQ